jgi:hypothetical protein
MPEHYAEPTDIKKRNKNILVILEIKISLLRTRFSAPGNLKQLNSNSIKKKNCTKCQITN